MKSLGGPRMTVQPLAPTTPSAPVTYYTQTPSPIGPLLLTSDGHALTRLYMSLPGPSPRPGSPPGAWGLTEDAHTWQPDNRIAPFPQAQEQLAAYFAGRLTAFDLPLALEGTPFQRRVWAALLTIPYGTTIS